MAKKKQNPDEEWTHRTFSHQRRNQSYAPNFQTMIYLNGQEVGSSSHKYMWQAGAAARRARREYEAKKPTQF